MPTYEQLSAQEVATLSGTTVIAVQIGNSWKRTTVQALRDFLLGATTPEISNTPTVQEVVDALVTLGLVTQAP